MYNVGIIGLGYWGKNILRNFYNNSDCVVTHLCDKDSKSFHNLPTYIESMIKCTNYNEITDNHLIDIVAIVTPPETHYKIAKKALLNNKHIFVEKPFTVCTEHAQELIDIAKQKNKKIVVDHTFLFTPSVQYMKRIIANKQDFGDLIYIDSVRINLGLFQRNVNVLYDLAPHDISIINYIVGSSPIETKALLYKTHPDFQDSVAYMSLRYPNNLIANIHVNWLSPVKIRKMIFCGSNKMCVYDDLEKENKLKIYNSGIDTLLDEKRNKEVLTGYRIGEAQVPGLQNTEALSKIVNNMITSIKENKEPLSNGETGLEVVRAIECCKKEYIKRQ